MVISKHTIVLSIIIICAPYNYKFIILKFRASLRSYMRWDFANIVHVVA